MNQYDLLGIAEFSPDLLQSNSAWLGHLPFASWVIQELKPKIFVELGTHYGHSYFAFCQSVLEEDLPTKCYAVDIWQGDEHAGLYDEEIFNKVNAHNKQHYAGFSHLLKMTFDEAVNDFADESIELLHIDGLHTYEAVRHDFENWLPKLAPGAVVLFHDTNVRERNFGVWKLWEELRVRYPNNLEFLHSYGLGVLQLNNAPDEKKIACLQPSSLNRQAIINYFAVIGARQLERFERGEVGKQIDVLNQEAANRDEQIVKLNQSVTERDGQIDVLNQEAANRDGQIANLNQTVTERDGEIANLNQAVTERDGRIDVLNQEAANRDEQIVNLKQAVTERDGQIANLNQAVTERDGQFANLNQAVTERDGQFANLNQAVTERDEIINQILVSTSWKITYPMRIIKSIFLWNRKK